MQVQHSPQPLAGAQETVVPGYEDNGTAVQTYKSTKDYGVFAKPAVLPTLTVATLPAAAVANRGARAFVSDSNAAMTAGIGAVVAGGGSNVVPVYSDGTNWRIG